MKTAFIFLSALALALAGPMVKRQLTATHYALPDGAGLVVGPISSSFSCDNLRYGYYADVANNCQIFHICVPSENGGKPQIYSFFCGNQTVFDQENLVCKYPASAVPCDQASSRYIVNENFGIIPNKSPQIAFAQGLS